MKKTLLFIGILIFLSCISYIIFVEAIPFLDYDEALLVGEEKYLEFLWLVDGAFDTKEQPYIVNGKELKEENKTFKCIYKNNKKSCIAKNFKETFDNLFSHTISYEKVYSDGVSFSRMNKKEDDYIFTVINTCNISEMPKIQTLEVINIERGKVEYRISFEENMKSGNKSLTRNYNKKFVLVYENKLWKISKAYYHDYCDLDYYIN